MEKKTGYRLRLKLRVGKALSTEDTAMTASVAGRNVTIKSERQSQPLSEASWLLIGCRGFQAERDARVFGEKLRRAVHLAGLCARVGVDAGDPGDDRTALVLPDDRNTLIVHAGRPKGTVHANAGDFVRALQEAFPAPAMSAGDCPSIRRAVRVLNLAEISTDPIAKVVLAVSTIEALATDPPWTDAQKKQINNAAAWLKRTHGNREETRQVVEAIRRIRPESIRQRIRQMLTSNKLSVLWPDWEDLYSKRSRLFHGGRRDGSEHRGDHLEESEVHALGQAAVTLCGRIVLSIAKREGLPVPSRAGVHFGVE